MARNRKRAKERRARRPQPVPARGRSVREEPTAAPLEHATPDAELAEAQMALGRPEPVEADDSEVAETEAAEAEPAETEGAELEEPSFDGVLDGEPLSSGDGAELVAAPGVAPERRPGIGHRLVTFLQGSWHELQRVQWPDRRQVMQATGVVIGFVIVAGVFLGVADFLAGKLMNYILK